MASSIACFANHVAFPATARFKAWKRGSEQIRIVCRAQRKVEDQLENQSSDVEEIAMISRRLATSLLIGSAVAVSTSNVSPAVAAYGEAGMHFQHSHS